jgi:hypothetical protein
MVGGNVIEGFSQNLKGACAFIEEGFLKFWVVEPPGLCGMRPPFHEHHIVNVFGNDAIKCHVFDVLPLYAVGASVVSLLATEPSAHWEGMADEQPHEAFDLGVGKGIEVGLADFLEVDAIVLLPGVFLNGVGTGPEHLGLIQSLILIPFNKGWSVLLDRAHVLVINMDHLKGKFDLLPIFVASCNDIEVLVGG